jgi:transcription antitermination factor NusG
MVNNTGDALAGSTSGALSSEPGVIWHVLHVKSRQEKALAADLVEMGIQHYLPLVNEIRYYGKRKFAVSLPLFPGYLFLHGTQTQAYQSERTHRVARIIPASDQAQLDTELASIRLALENNGHLAPHSRIARGTHVEVRSGPFRGLRGMVENPDKMNRIILCIETLGRAVSMEIDGRLLDVISPK